MNMRRISYSVLAAGVAGSVFLLAAPSQASMIVYDFNGTCTDCGGTPAAGVLTLQNYTPGANLTAANYVSFTYSSSLMPGFAFVGAPAFISGVLPTTSGAANFTLLGASTASTVVHPFYVFATSTTSDWSLLAYDTGTSGTFSLAAAVPEPASWALMLGGFALMGGAMRSRKRATVRFA